MGPPPRQMKETPLTKHRHAVEHLLVATNKKKLFEPAAYNTVRESHQQPVQEQSIR